MKRTIALAMMVVLVAGLAACAGDGTPSENNSPVSGDQGSASVAGDPVGTPSTPIDLLMVIWDPDIVPVCEQINAGFSEKYPGVNVTIDRVPGDTYLQVLSTRLAGGDAPDVFMFFGGRVAEIAMDGHWGDLSNEPFASRIIPGFRETSSYQGKLYALPMNCSGDGIFYNKTVFANAGVTSAPTTYSEFLAACEAIKATGVAPIVVGAMDVWPLQHMTASFAASYNQVAYPNFPYDMRDGKVTFATSKYPLIFEKIEELYNKGYFMDGVLGMTHDQAADAVANGEAAMYMNGSWTVAQFLDTNPSGEFGAFLLPNDEGQTGANAFCDKAIGFSPKSKNADWAKALVAYYAEPENATLFLNFTKTLPCLVDVQADELPQSAIEYGDALAVADGVFPFHEDLCIVQSAYQNYIDLFQGILAGEKDIIGTYIADMDKNYELDKDTIPWSE